MPNLKIILAQINSTVGDFTKNIARHVEAAKKARADNTDLIVFPELSLTGYPPEDLLLRPAFIKAAMTALTTCMAAITDIYCIVGHPLMENNLIYNACTLFFNGQIIAQYKKQCLPNNDVFDEYRYFTPGNNTCLVNIKNIPVSIIICEDVWHEGPLEKSAANGAKLIIIPNASPFEVEKHHLRQAILTEKAKQHRVAILYTNLIGGQDELVFDGGSMALDENGSICQCAPFFQETLLPIVISPNNNALSIEQSPLHLPSSIQKIYDALVLAVRDYINKNHFNGVLIGLSGGIDSALTLKIAVDALGRDKVRAVLMPSRYTADMSLEDAIILANRLKVKHDTISIEPTYAAFLNTLQPIFKDKKRDLTEENIQARCRGVILMALSNQSGYLVLTTGNRSELAVGYCTLYGDMAGGFAVLKDIPKMLVYELSHYCNREQEWIPERIITRPPTAELSPHQTDQDSLPPYPVLDAILENYLNLSKNIDEIVDMGFEQEIVEKVISLLYKNEYKRRQAAIGPHINYTSFGKGWRYPVTNKFKG